MVTVSKYLKDTEDTAPHVSVYVSQIHLSSLTLVLCYINAITILLFYIRSRHENALPNRPPAVPRRRRGGHGFLFVGGGLEAEAADRHQEEGRGRRLSDQVEEGRQAPDALHGETPFI